MMKYQISEVGKKMLKYQEDLAKLHHYKPIQPNLLDGDVREKYLETLPSWCSLSGAETLLCTISGTVLCSGYRRIVIGDYGAFCECSPEQINASMLQCKPGEEYRFQNERYAKNVKYLWLTPKDASDCKVYFQKKIVEYADYLPGMYYFSPFEAFPVSTTE